jgi:hypothetical protein
VFYFEGAMQGGAGRGAAGRKKPSKRVIGEIPQDDVSSFLLKGLVSLVLEEATYRT